MKRNIAIDAVALILYALASLPALTGVPVHEWTGLVLYLLFFGHVCLQTGWLATEMKRACCEHSARDAGRLFLNVLLLVCLTLVTLSGLMISGCVLPEFGLFAKGYFFWAPLHAFSAKAMLALILVHVAIHLKTVASVFAKRS